MLRGRSLRLIALSGLVYDDQAFYFELGDERFWGRLPHDRVSIGVGAAKVQPDAIHPPHRALIRHLRQQWQCDVDFFPAGHAYILGEDKQIVILNDVEAATPYFFILTAPQLGGADVPDALVQAVYLLPLRRWRGKSRQPLLQIQREALARFLEPADWELRILTTQPWATLHAVTPLPDDARLRPVMALRGLQSLSQVDALPNYLHA